MLEKFFSAHADKQALKTADQSTFYDCQNPENSVIFIVNDYNPVGLKDHQIQISKELFDDVQKTLKFLDTEIKALVFKEKEYAASVLKQSAGLMTQLKSTDTLIYSVSFREELKTFLKKLVKNIIPAHN